VALAAPFMGAVGDYRGMKKKLFAAFLAIGLAFTLSMALTGDWRLMLAGYICAYIGFTGSCLFYDSFLTDVTTGDRMDRVSSWGYAMGYIGGSTIPFVLSIGILLVLGMDNPLAVKLSVGLTVLWWGAFSIPMLTRVHQVHYVETPRTELVRHTLRNLMETVRAILRDRGMLVFMIAYFFYIDGVNTVIHMATIYGGTLGLDSTGMILALLVTQVVAVPCSILFGRLAAKTGSIRIIRFAILVYVVICSLGFYMGRSVESAAAPDLGAAITRAQTLFWLLAILVGTVQGGIQALSRSYFGKLVPPARSSEYFGFFDIFGKYAAVLGPLLYGVMAQATGRSSAGILSIAIFFVIAFLMLAAGRRQMALTEERNAGRRLQEES
jgi:UMF1 family MFS transporter